VTGVVLECPIEQGMEGFGRSGSGSGGGGKKKQVMGKIRLDVPVKSGEGDEEIITEVLLHPELYPGGTYAMNRVGSEMGSWIRPGDTMIFEVIQNNF